MKIVIIENSNNFLIRIEVLNIIIVLKNIVIKTQDYLIYRSMNFKYRTTSHILPVTAGYLFMKTLMNDVKC
jgi:hypothetical protein